MQVSHVSQEIASGAAISTAAPPLLHFQRTDWVRIALVPLFVAGCYLFSWTWLQSIDCAALVWLLELTGFEVQAGSASGFRWRGIQYEFAVSCTAMDALAGCIPLLWRRSESSVTNAVRLLGFTIIVSLLNLLRLWLGFALLRAGIPWVWGHEVVAGVFYFGLLAWIARERGWTPASVADSR